MSGTYARVDEARKQYAYTSSNGTAYYIHMQPKYQSVSGLTEITGTPTVPLWPFGTRNLRHIYIRTTEDNPTAGRLHSRRVPCKQLNSGEAPGSADGIDGLNDWKHGKLIGERIPV